MIATISLVIGFIGGFMLHHVATRSCHESYTEGYLDGYDDGIHGIEIDELGDEECI